MSRIQTVECANATGLPVTQTTFDHEVLENDEPVLVDFWAPWCGYCRAMKPVLEAIAAERGLKLVTINFDTEPDLAMRYAVQSIPNMIVFAHGKPTAQAIGAQPKADLERALGLIA